MCKGKENVNKKFKEFVKKVLVHKHGTDSCKRLADIPTCELTFSIIRENVEREYSKYKDKLTEEQYKKFIEEIFHIYKEYKINLDKAEEKAYGKIYGDYGEKIAETINKYGIRNN